MTSGLRRSLADRGLSVYPPDLCHEQSERLVFFVAGHIGKKEWAGVECRAVLDLLKKKHYGWAHVPVGS